MNNTIYVLSMIGVIASVTALIRFLPAIVFSKKTPDYIKYLSSVLPYAVIGMLIVYCVRNITILSIDGGAQVFAIILTAVLHKWRRDALFSILSGTISYMLLVNYIFV